MTYLHKSTMAVKFPKAKDLLKKTNSERANFMILIRLGGGSEDTKAYSGRPNSSKCLISQTNSQDQHLF